MFNKKIFTCFAIIPNRPDDLDGFRFNIFGIKGKYNKRQHKRIRLSYIKGECMNHFHFGKRSIYIEHNRNKVSERKFWHFAGQMRILLWKRKYVVYDDDGKVVIMCHNKRICQEYAEQIQTEKENES